MYYLLLLMAVALLAVLYNNYNMGIIFLTVLILPFFMLGLLCYQFGKVKVEIVSTAHIVNKGERIPITILVDNPTIFPIANLKIYLTYKNNYMKDKFKKEYQVSVDGRTKTTVVCKLSSEYAGNLEISFKGMRIYDYLKIFSLKRRNLGEIKVAVLPVYYEINQRDSFDRKIRMMESDQYSYYRSGDDPSEVFNIREYREGDRLQRIHWKLSRKQGQLMIKEFSDPMNCSILLLINLCTPSMEETLFYMDAILECALSLAYTFLRNGQPYLITWYDLKTGGFRTVRVEQEKDLYEAVDGLLQAKPYAQNIEVLSTYLAEHPRGVYTDLYYLTGDIPKNDIEMLSIIRAESKQLIYINEENQAYDEQELSEDQVEKFKEIGVDLWPVNLSSVRNDLEQLGVG